jgi:hypothetical protein
MRIKSAIAAALLLVTPVSAEEWLYDVFEAEPGAKIHGAWVAAEDRDYAIGFTCDEGLDAGAIYIQTDEPWEPTSSYADEVPTLFTSGDTAIEAIGAFQDIEGYLHVYFDEYEDKAKVYEIFDLFFEATAPVTVDFFTRKATFSVDLAPEKLGRAAYACDW